MAYARKRQTSPLSSTSLVASSNFDWFKNKPGVDGFSAFSVCSQPHSPYLAIWGELRPEALSLLHDMHISEYRNICSPQPLIGLQMTSTLLCNNGKIPRCSSYVISHLCCVYYGTVSHPPLSPPTFANKIRRQENTAACQFIDSVVCNLYRSTYEKMSRV